MADAPHGCPSNGGKRGSRSDICAYGSPQTPWKRKWAASNSVIVFVFKNEKQKEVSTHLVRDRTLVFSARSPWTFITKIPKKINKNTGGAEGGFQGGIPPRPPHFAILSPFSDDFAFCAKLRQFLLEVRTYFAENPEN